MIVAEQKLDFEYATLIGCVFWPGYFSVDLHEGLFVVRDEGDAFRRGSVEEEDFFLQALDCVWGEVLVVVTCGVGAGETAGVGDSGGGGWRRRGKVLLFFFFFFGWNCDSSRCWKGISSAGRTSGVKGQPCAGGGGCGDVNGRSDFLFLLLLAFLVTPTPTTIIPPHHLHRGGLAAICVHASSFTSAA